MKKKYNHAISTATETEAMRIARANQRPKQTKAQTKLIAQGIEKGIAQYKKQQKIKQREQDKQRRQAKKILTPTIDPSTVDNNLPNFVLLPWILLGISWFAIAIYMAINDLF